MINEAIYRHNSDKISGTTGDRTGHDTFWEGEGRKTILPRKLPRSGYRRGGSTVRKFTYSKVILSPQPQEDEALNLPCHHGPREGNWAQFRE